MQVFASQARVYDVFSPGDFKNVGLVVGKLDSVDDVLLRKELKPREPVEVKAYLVIPSEARGKPLSVPSRVRVTVVDDSGTEFRQIAPEDNVRTLQPTQPTQFEFIVDKRNDLSQLAIKPYGE